MLSKIGIIGAKPIGLGGHDIHNPIRAAVYQNIISILKQYHDQSIIGLTGLGLGVEQDFARACLDIGIEYNVYLPYDNQEDYWDKLDSVIQEYHRLKDAALNVKQINVGGFSTKKILTKTQRIIHDADIIIIVKDEFCKFADFNFQNKKTHLIDVTRSNQTIF